MLCDKKTYKSDCSIVGKNGWFRADNYTGTTASEEFSFLSFADLEMLAISALRDLSREEIAYTGSGGESTYAV